MRIALALVMLIASTALAQTKVSPQAQQITHDALVVDTHADTTQYFLDPKFNLADKNPGVHVTLDNAKAGNLGAEFFSVWVHPDWHPHDFAKTTLRLIDGVYEQARKNPDRMMMARSTDDIYAAQKQHKLAALMGIEGGHSIENDLGLLRDFYRLGVRYMTITWSNSTDWAESSGKVAVPGVKPPKGLTPFGHQVVQKMNRLGMMVDISHVSDQTFWDVIATTKAPVIASHSSARALTDHPRNMPDEMLKAVAKNGGVVQVNYFPAFIDDNYRKAYAAQSAAANEAVEKAIAGISDPAEQYKVYTRVEQEWANKVPRPPLKSLIDHIVHVAKVAGINHVGRGSDYDGVPILPQEIDSVADTPKITQALLDRGYKPDDIKKILGGNLMRVFKEVERVSREQQR